MKNLAWKVFQLDLVHISQRTLYFDYFFSKVFVVKKEPFVKPPIDAAPIIPGLIWGLDRD